MEAAGQDQVIVVSLEEKGNVTPGRKKNPAAPPPPFPRRPGDGVAGLLRALTQPAKGAGCPLAARSTLTPGMGSPGSPPRRIKTLQSPAACAGSTASVSPSPWGRDAPHLLPGGVLAAEGDGLELVAPAGQSPQAVVPALKPLLQELDGLPGSLLHLAGIACGPVLHLRALGQAIQLVYHFKQEEEVQLLRDKVLS